MNQRGTSFMNWRKYNKRSHARKQVAFGMWFLLITFFLAFYGYCKRLETVTKYTVDIVEAKEPEPKPLTLEEEIAQYICSKPWNCQDALKVARCESGLNPNALGVNHNGTVDRGVFQLNSVHKGISNADAFDYRKNTDYAVQKLYTYQGWGPWKSSYKCHGVK